MYTKLDWLTVHQLCVYHAIVAVYNIRRTQEPELLSKQLSRENIRGNIVIQNTRLSLFKKSFVVRGAELWNSVLLSVRRIDDCQMFKKLLKDWIAKNVVRFR